MELSEYIAILRKRWVTVALATLATVAVTALVTLLATPMYSASARTFFSVQGGDSVADLNQGSTFAERQITSYAEVAESPLVLQPVIDELGLETTPSDLAESTLSTSVPAETVILSIEATHEDRELAADIANAVSEELADTVGDMSPPRPDGSDSVQATILATATVPEEPSSPNTTRNLALGLVLGLLLGVGLAVLREILDTKVRSERDITAVTDRAVIGNIMFDEAGGDQPVFMHQDPTGPRAEAVRRLRTNLQFVDLADKPSSIVVTSSVPGEGKTTTAINVALALADTGARVALVDADLRRPSVAEYLGLEGFVGLTTVLIGRAEISEVVQPVGETGLDVLPSGQVPPNPSELLGSAAMSALLTELTAAYDVVIIDSPPLLPVTDATVLSKLVGGALVIAGADRIHKAEFRQALDALEQVHARVLGVVLNKVERKQRGGYYYQYDSYAPAEPTGELAADKPNLLPGESVEHKPQR
ncbi:polysaccharide biosynthesis tyrosine autokinase [Georgenia sp. 10Sc9-8]|uniref:Polysaccharide biosynthesis tyrosine autokinase n=1 Tax=Georgenia halotolerans TaxID=3028317 RepID=A0ABT5U123_9MICO|nr:polysaccharide biosynthesis tyrosine autokinase [Georgenia halotolerans]